MSYGGPIVSSRIKVKEVLSAVREMAHKLTQQDILDEQLKFFYKIALLEVASLLNGSLSTTYMQSHVYEDYPLTRPQDRIFILTLPNDFDRFVSLIVTNNSGNIRLGQAIFKNPSEFFAIACGNAGCSVYSKSIIATQLIVGSNSLLVRLGPDIDITDISTFDLRLYYLRQPKIDISFSDSDYVDLPDKYIPLLVKRMYSYCLIQTQGDIPTNFANEMANDYRQIAEFLNADLLNKGIALERK